MGVSITESQKVRLKKKIKKFYLETKNCRQTDVCPVKNILAPAVDKWSLFCLYNLAFNDVLRFNQIQKYTPGISSRMLSVTLKKLEKARLVKRTVYAEVPPRVEYQLTDFGYELAKRLIELNQWIFDENMKMNSNAINGLVTS